MIMIEMPKIKNKMVYQPVLVDKLVHFFGFSYFNGCVKYRPSLTSIDVGCQGGRENESKSENMPFPLNIEKRRKEYRAISHSRENHHSRPF